MAQRRRRKRTNPFQPKARRHRVRRRRNPATRSNPGGISGIVMGGVWVGAGMWLGGIVNGFIPSFGGGFIGNAIQGLASAYVVGWIGARFTRNAGLMAAGAFAGTALGLISGVVGSAGGIVGSITGAIGGGSQQPAVQIPKQSGTTGAAQAGSNVVQMPGQAA